MAEMQYQITETFLPGSLQQREKRLQRLLAEYRRMLEEQVLQDEPPICGPSTRLEQASALPARPAEVSGEAARVHRAEAPGAAPPACPAEASGAAPPACPAEVPGAALPSCPTEAPSAPPVHPVQPPCPADSPGSQPPAVPEGRSAP